MKTKHVNIRITPEIDKRIDLIQKEMISTDCMIYYRSQVILKLIQMGIEKYYQLKK